MALTILIIDDDPMVRLGLNKMLIHSGYTVKEASSGNGGKKILKEEKIDLILLDLMIGEESGLDLLKEFKKTHPLLSIIIITGHGDVKWAVKCMHAGAKNFIPKPVDYDYLIELIHQEEERINLRNENINLKKSIVQNVGPIDFKSCHGKIKKIDSTIEQIKDYSAPVMILGETGTGKEVTAKKIHYSGIFKDRPFIGINCASFNENLLESELFGHEKGSFTGAVARKQGRFELAGDGTLFLDEVGDMSLRMQIKLLRVLQEKKFERVGGTETLTSRCRIISATNKNLKELIQKEEFREDLYYRLSLVVIDLPPLRERLMDFPALIKRFIDEANLNYNRYVKDISEKAMKTLTEYSWPGNIRQLKNVITNAVIFTRTLTIEEVNLPGEKEEKQEDFIELEKNLNYTLKKYIGRIEKKLITREMDRAGGNVSKAAKSLGVSRKTLYEKMKKYDLYNE